MVRKKMVPMVKAPLVVIGTCRFLILRKRPMRINERAMKSGLSSSWKLNRMKRTLPQKPEGKVNFSQMRAIP